MRVSVLETETFESQSQLSRSRLSEASLSFMNQTEKLLMVKNETETETRLWTIFETTTTRDRARPMDVETESLADLWDPGLIPE